jgi:hypothetical protein
MNRLRGLELDTIWLHLMDWGRQGIGVEFADAAFGAYDEGEGEGVPVLVGVGGLGGEGFEGAPVAAVVGGDVGAVGAHGDPEFLGGGVGYGGTVAVGWGLGGVPGQSIFQVRGCGEGGRPSCVLGISEALKVTANCYLGVLCADRQRKTAIALEGQSLRREC